MDIIYKFVLTGSFVGFIIFVGLLESPGLGSVWYRNGQIVPKGILAYILSPLYQRFLWYPQCWKHNWIIMTMLGSFIGYVLYYLL